MPTTRHKFYDELTDTEKSAKDEYKILIVGTFNADFKRNDAKWFYGRSESEFWFLLPKSIGFDSLYASDLNVSLEEASIQQKEFCAKHGIMIIDIFKTVTTEEHLNSHSDKKLKNLSEGEYETFNFKSAFSNCSIGVVAFTWRSEDKSTKNKIKSKMIEYFEEKGIKCISLISPSQAAPGGRYKKLQEWRLKFNPHNQ